MGEIIVSAFTEKAEAAIRLIERAANEPLKRAIELREFKYIDDEQRFKRAMQYVDGLDDFLSDVGGPDPEWFRDYFLLTGDHWFCGEEGWEPGENKALYLKDDPNWQPICEVNAPAPHPQPEAGRMNE